MSEPPVAHESGDEISPAGAIAAKTLVGVLIVTGGAIIVASWNELWHPCGVAVSTCVNRASTAALLDLFSIGAIGSGVALGLRLRKRPVGPEGSSRFVIALGVLFGLGLISLAASIPAWSCARGRLDPFLEMCVHPQTRSNATSWLLLKRGILLVGLVGGVATAFSRRGEGVGAARCARVVRGRGRIPRRNEDGPPGMKDAPVLTQAQLHRALLARQHLLERARVSVPKAVEQLGGLQTQYAPSAYIGLWSRLEGFEREHLTRALERKKVVQGTMMRATIHMASARDYPFVVEGVRAARRAWWQRATRDERTAKAMRAAARRVRTLLAKGPLRRSELVELFAADGSAWNGVELWIDLLRIPPSGTWEQRRADLYATAEQWLGSSKASEAEGIELLVRRYLGAFGPASDKDIANWAGLPTRAIAPAIQRLKLRRFRDERGTELLDVRGGPLPDPETPVPARFLPTWDATLLVHARRTQILPERYRPLVFNTKTPHSVTTFLVDGRVAGTWRSEGGRVTIQPFEGLSRGSGREIREEAERLTTFLR